MTWAVCDPADSAIGLDLAHWQGTDLPWRQCMDLGVEWAVSKTWHGAGMVKSARPQVDSARAAGLPILGRYAWMLPDDDLAAQVRAWASIQREPDETPLTIDWEEPGTALRGRALVARLEYAIERVSDAIGRRPEVYTGDWFWLGYCGDLDSEVVASCPLWLAAYPRKTATGVRYREAVAEVCGGAMPRVPRPWRQRGVEPTRWQFDGDHGLYLPTPAGSTSSADVDVNAASRSRLRALLPVQPREPAPTQPDTPANPIGRQDRAEQESADAGAAQDDHDPGRGDAT